MFSDAVMPKVPSHESCRMVVQSQKTLDLRGVVHRMM